jgi:hypothetical protein
VVHYATCRFSNAQVTIHTDGADLLEISSRFNVHLSTVMEPQMGLLVEGKRGSVREARQFVDNAVKVRSARRMVLVFVPDNYTTEHHHASVSAAYGLFNSTSSRSEIITTFQHLCGAGGRTGHSELL